MTHLAPSVGDTCVPLLEVPMLVALQEEKDSCCPPSYHHHTSLIPNLEDMITFQCSAPDVIKPSPVPEITIEDIKTPSPKYLYEENQLSDRFKTNR